MHDLTSAETALYMFLDCGVKQELVEQMFLRDHPNGLQGSNGIGDVGATVDLWLRNELVLAVDGRVVGLALHADRMTLRDQEAPEPQVLENARGAFLQLT